VGTPLPKAPIIFALADLRFLPVEAINAGPLAASVQDALRKIGFPHYVSSKSVQFKIPTGGGAGIRFHQEEVSRFDYFDLARSWVITLDKGHLTVATTAYIQWDEFRPRYEQIVDTVMDVLDAKSIVIQRVGYRTIDQICPEEGEKVEDVINPIVVGRGLEAVNTPGANTTSTRSQCFVAGDIEREDKIFSYIVGCEVINQKDHEPPLPPELMGPPPTMPVISPKQQPANGANYSRLSIDIIYNRFEEEQLFFLYKKNDVLKMIENQKMVANQIFKKLIDPKSLELWGTSTGEGDIK